MSNHVKPLHVRGRRQTPSAGKRILLHPADHTNGNVLGRQLSALASLAHSHCSIAIERFSR